MTFALAGLLAALGFLDGRANRVGRLGRRDDALGCHEADRGLEHVPLAVSLGLDEALVQQVAHQGRGSVVAQAARMDARGNEGMAQGMHADEGRQAGRIAEVVRVVGPG